MKYPGLNFMKRIPVQPGKSNIVVPKLSDSPFTVILRSRQATKNLRRRLHLEDFSSSAIGGTPQNDKEKHSFRANTH